MLYYNFIVVYFLYVDQGLIGQRSALLMTFCLRLRLRCSWSVGFRSTYGINIVIIQISSVSLCLTLEILKVLMDSLLIFYYPQMHVSRRHNKYIASFSSSLETHFFRYLQKDCFSFLGFKTMTHRLEVDWPLASILTFYKSIPVRLFTLEYEFVFSISTYNLKLIPSAASWTQIPVKKSR